MPERIALTKITLGVGTKRHDVQPGERFNFSDEQIAELNRHQPPVIVDPRAMERRPVAPIGDETEGAGGWLSRVAEPDTGDGDENTTREPVMPDDGDEL